MYPSSLIHCYKYLLFTWRDDIKMLHSTGFGSLTACPLFFQGTLRSFAFIHNALKEVTHPHTHTSFAPSLYTTNLWSIHPSSLPLNYPSTLPYISRSYVHSLSKAPFHLFCVLLYIFVLVVDFTTNWIIATTCNIGLASCNIKF